MIVMKIIYFDSMIYPLYCTGYLLHVITCILYLFNAQAPMSPSNPVNILIVWLPLYIIKVLTQILAFRGASLDAHMQAQKAWAGYALSTIVSIKQAFVGTGYANNWFNTGDVTTRLKSKFYLQWGNMTIFICLLVFLGVRIMRFITTEDNCQAWETFGALFYGFGYV